MPQAGAFASRWTVEYSTVMREVTARQSAYLNAWRGASAIVVVNAHTASTFDPDPLPIWGTFATAAVMVFFVISGFFISKSLERNRSGFVIARANRLLPPFLFVMALTALLWMAAPYVFPSGTREFVIPTSRPSYSIDGWGWSLAFVGSLFGPTISANGPLWSLTFEVWYYVLAYFWVAVRRWLAALLLLPLAYFSYDFLELGIVWLIGFAIGRLHSLDRLPRWPQWPFLVPALVAFPLMLDGRIYNIWMVAAGLAFAAHLLWVLRREPRSPRWLAGTSDWSYTLYILHMPLLLFLYGAFGGSFALPAFIAAIALAALIGPTLEHFRPFRRKAIEHPA